MHSVIHAVNFLCVFQMQWKIPVYVTSCDKSNLTPDHIIAVLMQMTHIQHKIKTDKWTVICILYSLCTFKHHYTEVAEGCSVSLDHSVMVQCLGSRGLCHLCTLQFRSTDSNTQIYTWLDDNNNTCTSLILQLYADIVLAAYSFLWSSHYFCEVNSKN